MLISETNVPAALDALQLAFIDQIADGLADGGAADLELLAQFQLGGNLGASFPYAGFNLLLNEGFQLKIKRYGAFAVQLIEFFAHDDLESYNCNRISVNINFYK